ncbi:uncharacterized protein PFL1_03958 [Pseudozyma flocculosa PF-1]|uniref:Related to Aldose 1-epimerase n=2 Tax=Pseudozyma flocculosa TaxID=84751 RepID=A0A5C3F028_9BASI|nr:uncharacterized protein PFL1_03958 [Pseudozyma flocculosa PF-1]EPQ28655.1 hypothetical protein PFL1_03958 [Pseudozyma flocculosa PF-1]SPO36601.1 related to Aldose 1-epimerase precursor [Pseudozyma flocculosa]
MTLPRLSLLLPVVLQLLGSASALPSPAAVADETPLWLRQADAANSTSTSSAAESRSTPGFVNNGTIGSYDCSTSASSSSQVSFSTVPGSGCVEAQPPVYPYNAINLRSSDDSIRATVLPYGSVVSELWVKDRYGGWRDVVLGFDNKTNYGTDTIHPNFSPIVGRYANRIKNGTFEVDGKTYKAPLNENNLDTLHGGDIGYDRSAYRVEEVKADEILLSHLDPDGFQGFPGEVKTYTRYRLLPDATWEIELNATASKRTPLMLSSHVYWNLEAYNESQTILDHVLHLPKADKYVKTDTILIPTGELPTVEGTPYDFRTPHAFRDMFNETLGVCGFNCTGWDSCFVMTDPPKKREAKQQSVIELSSLKSGIKLSVSASNQPAIQVYTCSGINSPAKGSIPRKRSHGGDGTLDKVYDNYSCVVLEMEDYIDGINNPQWGRDQIYGPDRPYHWRAKYSFSNIDEQGKAM